MKMTLFLLLFLSQKGLLLPVWESLFYEIPPPTGFSSLRDVEGPAYKTNPERERSHLLLGHKAEVNRKPLSLHLSRASALGFFVLAVKALKKHGGQKVKFVVWLFQLAAHELTNETTCRDPATKNENSSHPTLFTRGRVLNKGSSGILSIHDSFCGFVIRSPCGRAGRSPGFA